MTPAEMVFAYPRVPIELPPSVTDLPVRSAALRDQRYSAPVGPAHLTAAIE